MIFFAYFLYSYVPRAEKGVQNYVAAQNIFIKEEN